MNTMTLADAAVVYVWLCGLLIAALTLTAVVQWGIRAWSDLLNGAAGEID